MKISQRFTVAASLLGCVAMSPAIGAVSPNFNTTIRVLLDRESRTLNLSSSKGSLYYRAHGKWRQRTAPWRVEPGEIKSPIIVRGGTKPEDALSLNGKPYQGSLKILPNKNSWMVINIVGIEYYLAGTLASEMSPSWPTEALKAQAVASRTYAFYMKWHPRHPEFDLLSTVADQVYGGLTPEHATIDEAVRSTRGEILLQDQQLTKVFYHSRCGGQTEPESAVWSNKSQKHMGVLCPFCRKEPYNWKTEVTLEKFKSLIGVKPASPFKAAVKSLPSGRIRSLRVLASKKYFSVPSETLRRKVGYSKLKSARFLMRKTPSGVEFSGTGNGHGVGMCQWGARYLAKKGSTYQQILKHYYPRFTLHKPPKPPEEKKWARSSQRADRG